MAFFNGRKRSKLFVALLLTLSMIATFSMPISVYAAEDNAREPTLTEGILAEEGSDLIPPAEGTDLTSTEKPVLTPAEDPEQELPPVDSEPGPQTEPEQGTPVAPEQGSLPESNLTNYVVEYVTADGADLLEDKVVEDQPVGSEISENAVEIEGYSVDESSKSITLGEDENIITFIYTQVEAAEEDAPPVVEIPATGEEVVTDPAIVVEETATEPAIVVEPVAATLTITHRLIIGDNYADEIRVIDGLEVGQTVDLTEYFASIYWAECITQEKSITLDLEENAVLLEYVVRADTDVNVVIEDGAAMIRQDANDKIEMEEKDGASDIAR